MAMHMPMQQLFQVRHNGRHTFNEQHKQKAPQLSNVCQNWEPQHSDLDYSQDSEREEE